MTEKLIKRINEFNKINYVDNNNNETRIIITTLKPQEAVSTALKNKE